MLGKLCKYEFRSVGRSLVPIYIAAIVMSFIVSIFININYGYRTDSYNAVMLESNLAYQIQQVLSFVTMLAYFAIMVALFVLTVVIILQRFYKGLLCDEGYLMFSLPVKTWQLITSKGIVACVMALLSCIVSFCSMIIIGIVSSPDPLGLLAELLSPSTWAVMFKTLNANMPMWGLYLFEIIVLCILTALSSLYQIYASMAIGHLAKKNRILMSIVAYIGISVVLSFIGGFAGVMITNGINFWLVEVTNNMAQAGNIFLQILLLLLIAFSVVEFIVFFFITERILSKKLNLE